MVFAWLQGNRIEDVRNLAEEYGGNPGVELGIPELGKIMLESSLFDEEDAKEILRVIIEEREEREEIEERRRKEDAEEEIEERRWQDEIKERRRKKEIEERRWQDEIKERRKEEEERKRKEDAEEEERKERRRQEEIDDRERLLKWEFEEQKRKEERQLELEEMEKKKERQMELEEMEKWKKERQWEFERLKIVFPELLEKYRIVPQEDLSYRSSLEPDTYYFQDKNFPPANKTGIHRQADRRRGSFRCFECQEEGHLRRNCPKLRRSCRTNRKVWTGRKDLDRISVDVENSRLEKTVDDVERVLQKAVFETGKSVETKLVDPGDYQILKEKEIKYLGDEGPVKDDMLNLEERTLEEVDEPVRHLEDDDDILGVEFIQWDQIEVEVEEENRTSEEKVVEDEHLDEERENEVPVENGIDVAEESLEGETGNEVYREKETYAGEAVCGNQGSEGEDVDEESTEEMEETEDSGSEDDAQENDVSSEVGKPAKKRRRRPAKSKAEDTPAKRRGKAAAFKYAEDPGSEEEMDEAPKKKGREAEKKAPATSMRRVGRQKKPTKYTEDCGSEVEEGQAPEKEDYEPEMKADTKENPMLDFQTELWCFKGGGGTLSDDFDDDNNDDLEHDDGPFSDE